jgi:hypothetical protein
MAAGLTTAGLTLNAKENPDFAKFVFERVFEQGNLGQNHRVWSGVKMQEQIVFASLFGKSGITDAGTARPNSGNKPTLTQKYWNPKRIGDTLIFNNSELNSLFKAYYDKIQKYSEIYDITGTDEEKFLLEVFADSAMKAVNRYVWFGDTAVAVSGAGAAGLIAAADVKFYDAVDGLWKKIYASVTAAATKKFAITKNTAATFALQALAADESLTIFEGVWALADARLKADPNKVMMVTNTVWENYRQSLQSKGTAYDITLTTDGFREVKWNGTTIRNMETLWDLTIQADYEKTNAHAAFDNPHRVLLTTADNIPVATLNEGDLSELEAFYYQKDRTNYMAYGFTLDAQLLEGYMAVAAY